MIRPARIGIAACLIVALTTPPYLHAHGGGHGGGGHGGGGHMGGGHMGGGHMGGGHIGGGHHMGGGGLTGSHMGGFNAHSGFSGGSHIGGQHMGGVQHFGGVQHLGGLQHQGIQHQGLQHQGVQHLGGMQHQSVLNGVTHPQGNNAFHGGQQHLGNAVTTHHLNSQFYSNHAHTGSALGNNATHHANSTILSNTHNNHASQFLQHHGNAQHNASLASMSSQHHSSQFLQHHGTQGALAHNGLQNHGLYHQGQQSFGNHQNVGNSAFLAHHHQTTNSTFNNHHNGINGLGQNNALHHNHVGNYVHNSLTQNFNYRHHGYVGGGVGNYGYRHHGWGGWGGYGYRGYGGWGLGYYPFYGFGFGLGRFGYGWGYGYGGYGYGRWGCFAYQPCCYYQPYGYGYGYPGYGYGSYGYNGYGYGGYASLSPGLMGYGYGATYAPYGSSMAIVSSTPVMTDASSAAVPADPVQIASVDPKSAVTSALPTPEQYAAIGETAFKARDYKGAVRAWRHGLIDDPNNGVLVLMLSQALFASEQFNESAGATQFGMQQIPQDKWDTVVKNYRELYGKVEDYTNQLRALEKVAREKTDDPALRFLLGYHYGFLGYPKEAVQQLEKCVSLAPEDETAQKLLEYFSDKLPKDPNKKVDPPAPGKPPEPGSTTDNGKLPALNPTLLPPAPTTPEPIEIPKAADGN